MFKVNTYVQVDGDGGVWYGRIAQCVGKDAYLVRMGGSDLVFRVPSVRISLHPAVQAYNQRRVRAEEEPYRVGVEVEIPSAELTLRDKGSIENGKRLAHSETTELNTSVLDLRTEGADRGSLCIELNYGPLLLAEYSDKYYLAAQKKLYSALSATIDSVKSFRVEKNQPLLSTWIELYTESLKDGETRYALVLDDASGYNLKRKMIKMNQQTNVSLPYGALTRQEVVNVLFDKEKKDDLNMYQVATKGAWAIIGHLSKQKDEKCEDAATLLAHAAYMKGMYRYHRMEWRKEKKGDKHNFHVMFKISPQDAIFTILDDDVVVTLLKDQDRLRSGLVEIVKKMNIRPYTFKDKDYNEMSTEFDESLFDVLKLRKEHGRQLLPRVNKDDEESPVLTKGGNKAGSVRHFHPRPTNRIPIYTDKSQKKYFVVIEQRSASHPFNEGSKFNTDMLSTLKAASE
jgi:hypothetical protein